MVLTVDGSGSKGGRVPSVRARPPMVRRTTASTSDQRMRLLLRIEVRIVAIARDPRDRPLSPATCLRPATSFSVPPDAACAADLHGATVARTVRITADRRHRERRMRCFARGTCVHHMSLASSRRGCDHPARTGPGCDGSLRLMLHRTHAGVASRRPVHARKRTVEAARTRTHTRTHGTDTHTRALRFIRPPSPAPTCLPFAPSAQPERGNSADQRQDTRSDG